MAMRADSARNPRGATTAKKTKTSNTSIMDYAGSQNPTAANMRIVQNGVSSPAAKQDALSAIARSAMGLGTSSGVGPTLNRRYTAPAAPPSNGTGGLGTSSTGTVAPYQTMGYDQNAGAAATGSGMTDEQYLTQDSQYLDETSQLQREYENLLAELGQSRANYELDTQNSFRNLGWDPKGKVWNKKDRLTGFGQAFNNQQGDFASRGLMDSSMYASALNDLFRGFDQQVSDINNAQGQFIAGQNVQSSNAAASKEAAIAAAQRQALARKAAGL